MNTSINNDIPTVVNINKRMGKVWIELLTKATLCAAAVALIAGMIALLFRSE